MMKNVSKKSRKVPYLLMLMLFTCLSASAQFQVKGTIVSDKDSEPMIGVAVLEKGTSNGTITDIDGNYSISVQNGNATLEVSYVGCRPQTIQVNGRNQIHIRLEEDSKMLDEVVVVGYGLKEDSTPDAVGMKQEIRNLLSR